MRLRYADPRFHWAREHAKGRDQIDLPGRIDEHAFGVRGYLQGRADERGNLSVELAKLDELQRRAERTLAELFELARTEARGAGRPTDVQPR